MEYELTDTHCHILPGLDDGSLNMEETLQVLREAERQNVGRMIVTPHFYPGKYEPGGGAVAIHFQVGQVKGTGVLLLLGTGRMAGGRKGPDFGGKPVRAGGI